MAIFKKNPKVSHGLVTAIPQKGTCPLDCKHCYFNHEGSYVYPHDEFTPNVPELKDCEGLVVRINDGNDSNVQKDVVLEYAAKLRAWKVDHFFNTSIPDIDFPGPVALTVNPGAMTDTTFWQLDLPGVPRVVTNHGRIVMGKIREMKKGETPTSITSVATDRRLMFVRARVNTWNLPVVDEIVEFYAGHGVPVVLTFMAYRDGGDEDIPVDHRKNYMLRKRTLNVYFAITTGAWDKVMARYKYNALVHSCGAVEGELGNTGCHHCGNCIREYFRAKVSMIEGGTWWVN